MNKIAMNKTTLWIIVIVALVILSYFIFFRSGGNKEPGEPAITIVDPGESFDNIPESEFEDLETEDDVFNEIDGAIEEIG
jgi:flagellar basal body-associated protein FliL